MITDLARNQYAPRVVQIISRQDDVYGRHFYLGQDDRGRSERIFTPLPLEVGRVYLFYPPPIPRRLIRSSFSMTDRENKKKKATGKSEAGNTF